MDKRFVFSLPFTETHLPRGGEGRSGEVITGQNIIFAREWEEGGDGSRISQKNSAQPKRLKNNRAGKKSWQVLSTKIILIFDVKKLLHKLLPTKNNHAQPQVERKVSSP